MMNLGNALRFINSFINAKLDKNKQNIAKYNK